MSRQWNQPRRLLGDRIHRSNKPAVPVVERRRRRRKGGWVRFSESDLPHVLDIGRKTAVLGCAASNPRLDALGEVHRSEVEPLERMDVLIHLTDAVLPLVLCVRTDLAVDARVERHIRSEEHTSELQSLMRNSYAV